MSILVPTPSVALLEIGAGRVVVRVITCILVSGSNSTGGVELDEMEVGSEDVLEGVSLSVSQQISNRSRCMTYEDDISVVSMVELVDDSVVVLLLDTDRAMGELKA
jgi:hypothetical protein